MSLSYYINSINTNDPALTELYLDSEEMDDETFIKLGDVLKNNTMMEKIIIKNGNGKYPTCDILYKSIEVGFIYFCNVIKTKKNIKSLYFNDNEFTDKAIVVLVNLLKPSEDNLLELTELTLNSIYSCREIKSDLEYIPTLIDSLKYNSSLRHLCIHCCEIKEPGLRGIITSIMENSKLNLKSLDMSGYFPSMSNEVIKTLVTYIIDNKHLKVLKLANNNFKGFSYQQLFDAFSENKSLEEINIEYNQFDLQDLLKFVNSIKSHPTLKKIHWGNYAQPHYGLIIPDLTPDEDKEIANILENNYNLISFRIDIASIGDEHCYLERKSYPEIEKILNRNSSVLLLLKNH